MKIRCLPGVVHDEILVETVDNIVDTGKKFVEQTMIEAGGFYLKPVPPEVDVTNKYTWR